MIWAGRAYIEVRPNLLDLLAGHDCLQGPLCWRWYDPGDPDGRLPTVPIDGCGHRSCMTIVNDVAR